MSVSSLGNKSALARKLGISRNTLDRYLRGEPVHPLVAEAIEAVISDLVRAALAQHRGLIARGELSTPLVSRRA